MRRDAHPKAFTCRESAPDVTRRKFESVTFAFRSRKLACKTIHPAFFSITIMEKVSKKRKAPMVEAPLQPKKAKFDASAAERDSPGQQSKISVQQDRSRPNGGKQTSDSSSGLDRPAVTANTPGDHSKSKGKKQQEYSSKRRHNDSQSSKARVRKLAPQRPFPIVPTSVSATGPRSAHKEGKNMICITRKTPLGAYLRRCKSVVMEDGYVISFQKNFWVADISSAKL